MATRYNDKSVLESHHVALAFDIMHNSDNMRIFDTQSTDDYKKFRVMIIAIVLETYMAKHFVTLSEINSRLSSNEFNPVEKDKSIVMNFVCHLADISNPTKPWNLCYRWTELLFVEFFKQGDKEREFGLPISFLMDRETTNIAKAQNGFINGLIKPSFKTLQTILPQVQLNLNIL